MGLVIGSLAAENRIATKTIAPNSSVSDVVCSLAATVLGPI
jgi:hypothetical protein